MTSMPDHEIKIAFSRADVSMFVYRRLYELARMLSEDDFIPRAEELVHLVAKI